MLQIWEKLTVVWKTMYVVSLLQMFQILVNYIYILYYIIYIYIIYVYTQYIIYSN